MAEEEKTQTIVARASDFQEKDAKPVTLEDVQRAETWSENPEGQMLRFEVGASLAEEQNLKEFLVDGKKYDTKYVQEFIAEGREVNPNLLKQPFFLDV